MSELTLLWGAVSLRLRLAFRVAASAAALFAILLLSRTVFDSTTPPRVLDDHEIELRHIACSVIYAPVLWLYLAISNAAFRSTNRRTAFQSLKAGVKTGARLAFFFGPMFVSMLIAVHGVEGHRLLVTGVAAGVMALPVLFWVILNPGVATVLRNADQKAEERRKKRRRAEASRLDNKMARIRRKYQQRLRQIEALPINAEERRHLKELAEMHFRDRIHDLVGGGRDDRFDFDALFDNQ